VYDVRRAEVRRAVAEARSELKKVIPGWLLPFATSNVLGLLTRYGLLSQWTLLLKLNFICQVLSDWCPCDGLSVGFSHHSFLWYNFILQFFDRFQDEAIKPIKIDSTELHVYCLSNSLKAKSLLPKFSQEIEISKQFHMMHGRFIQPSLSRFVWNSTKFQCWEFMPLDLRSWVKVYVLHYVLLWAPD
jgi:hypothetical protein